MWWEPEGREPLLDTVTRHPRDYELMVILLPDMPEEDNQAALDRVRGYITGVQGEISEVLTDSPWGRRRLAYTIRHESVDYRDGYYLVIHFSAAPTAMGDIERELKLDTNVIRYLLVTDDPKAGEKSIPQPEGAVAAGEGSTEATAAATTEESPATEDAPAAERTPATEDAPAKTPAAEDAPAAEAAPVAEEASTPDAPAVEQAAEAPAAEETTEAAVEETAETIEGEEEPTPADGAEVVTADTKES